MSDKYLQFPLKVSHWVLAGTEVIQKNQKTSFSRCFGESVFFPRPERFHWQACALKLAGVPVKTRRPAKFAPSAAPSERGA